MNKKPTRNLLDKVTPEDLKKIQEYQTTTEGAYPVDQEWMLLAEFAIAYGWQAYLDARDDNITGAEMLTLIEANRKLEAVNIYEITQAVFIGQWSSQSKRPSATFNRLMKDIIRRTKVHE